MDPSYRPFWAEVIHDHYGTILKRARFYTNHDESRAEDLTQRVVQRILERSPNPTTVENIIGYLLKITFHCWTETKPRVQEISIDYNDEEQDALSPEPSIEPPTEKNAEQKEILQQVIEDMHVDQNDVCSVLRLKAEGYKYAQIDRKINKDPGFAQAVWRNVVNKARRRAE